MSNNIRMNVNVDCLLYKKFQDILKKNERNMSAYINGCIVEYVKKDNYISDKNAFDDLANEEVTKELLPTEKECINDGL